MSRHTALISAALALLATGALAEPDRSHLSELSVDQLKQAYLACDQQARRGLLDPGEASACSMLHEELRQRGFSGDFRRMLAWWSTQSRPDAVQASPRDARH